MRQLIHNGVLIPAPYQPQGFVIKIRGKPVALNPLQEEMAVKFAQKFGTQYVEDRTFCLNFMSEFGKALGIKERLTKEDIEWTPIVEWVEAERARKANLSREERKSLAGERKRIREQNKEKYGWAIVDGQRMEVGNYSVEPPGIFLGRGSAPRRGRWKPPVSTNDVELNLSPDAPTPAGEWKGRVWAPEEMWIARWKDYLTGKMKYVWLADHTPIRQERTQDKFRLAEQLASRIEKVRAHIDTGLRSDEEKIRKIATVCALIDQGNIRVGDEKDVKEEADTLGAVTLRKENLSFNGSKVRLDFLGKDSVRFRRDVEFPELVVKNLREFSSKAKSEVFSGINSNMVREYLSIAMPGLGPKVFRTYAATKTFKEHFRSERVKPTDDDPQKLQALLRANAAVATLLNHQKTPPKKWQEVYEKRKAMLAKLRGKQAKSTQKRRASLRLRLEAMRLTKQLNLGTSLRNYISPFLVKELCDRTNLDWKKFYPKALVKKFAFVEKNENK